MNAKSPDPTGSAACCSRRDFLKLGATSCATVAATGLPGCGKRLSTTASSAVHVVSGQSLLQMHAMAMEATRKLGLTRGSLGGARVFIKPNLVSIGTPGFRAHLGEVTKPEILLGIAEQCLEAGAAQVTIGEGGQVVLWDWRDMAFLDGVAIHGARDLRSGVEWLQGKFGDGRIRLACLNLLDDWVPVPSSSADPVLRDGLWIARSFHEADHVISVPVLKSHVFAQISGALMNHVGVTPLSVFGDGGMLRHRLHNAYADTALAGFDRVGIAGAFLDIHRSRQCAGKQDFAIVDATIGVEGNGPLLSWLSDGQTLDLAQRCGFGRYFLLASADPLAADAVSARIIGLEETQTRHLVMARRLDPARSGSFRLSGASLGDLQVRGFRLAQPHDAAMFRLLG